MIFGYRYRYRSSAGYRYWYWFQGISGTLVVSLAQLLYPSVALLAEVHNWHNPMRAGYHVG